MGTAITVLLVDDHAVVREGYRRLLERDSTISVVGEAGNSVQACEQAAALEPDVIVMDIALPGVSGIEAMRRILARRPQQEGVRTGQTGAQDAELPGIQPRKPADLGERGAHQREVMVAVGLADAAHALQRALVADVPAERVTGIGRIGNDASRAHQLRRAADEPQLRINGV